MSGNDIEKLVEEFSHFPGVGPRQAKRFVFYLLTRDEKKLKAFTDELLKAKKSIANCVSCGRLFIKPGKTALCGICADAGRDAVRIQNR